MSKPDNPEVVAQLDTSHNDTGPTHPISNQRAGLLRRIGCWLLVIIWFAILLLPCFFIVLATQQEITISQGGLPGQQIRIWLIMDAAQRGLGISSTSAQEFDNQSCLQTNVQYVLWQGEGESTMFCDCFTRSGETWLLADTYPGVCTQE